MPLTPDEIDARLDAYLAKMLKGIEEHGWMIQGVFGTEAHPGTFSYTVGLSEKDKPELFIDGLNPSQSGSILNAVARMIDTAALVWGPGIVFDAEFSTHFRWHGPIDVAAAEMNVAKNLYIGVVAYQVLWPDREGKFPGDPGYDADNFAQRVMPLA